MLLLRLQFHGRRSRRRFINMSQIWHRIRWAKRGQNDQLDVIPFALPVSAGPRLPSLCIFFIGPLFTSIVECLELISDCLSPKQIGQGLSSPLRHAKGHFAYHGLAAETTHRRDH